MRVVYAKNGRLAMVLARRSMHDHTALIWSAPSGEMFPESGTRAIDGTGFCEPVVSAIAPPPNQRENILATLVIPI